ncbi:MAG: PhoH family protein [Candidatus Omnitrophica bacterium]|nr:PhoH family protein [Candidatus Omnitrophota bacterium]
MERRIEVKDSTLLREIFGVEDKNLRFIETQSKVKISLTSQGILVKGTKVNIEEAIALINKIISLGKAGLIFKRDELEGYISSHDTESSGELSGIKVPSAKRKMVTPKTEGQEEYIKAIKDFDIVFSTGPAGTGKTYLAMTMAVNYLMEKKIRRIILARPAREAGESLGFLPGGMQEKLGPYLRPLYDALYDMMEAEVIEEYLETGIIEVAPLAYMRGRTLNNAFVILDEAQNCTAEQLKMFLTRLGFDSKAVITGDITQSDLPGGRPMGLIEAIKILKGIKGIKFISLTKRDVVRHPLIQQIVQAYEDFYSEKPQ